jgi:hypothetical protein
MVLTAPSFYILVASGKCNEERQFRGRILMNTCNGSHIKKTCLYNLLKIVISFGTNLDYRLVYRKGGLGLRSSCSKV